MMNDDVNHLIGLLFTVQREWRNPATIDIFAVQGLPEQEEIL